MGKEENKVLTHGQSQALDIFKEIYGEKWKYKLSSCWINSCYPSISDEHAAQLQGIRNQFGPSWLVNYEG